MKIWLKTVLAAAAGLSIGALLARRDAQVAELVSSLARIATQFGGYAVFPCVFFGLVIGTHQLRAGGAALRVYRRLVLYLAGSTALLVGVGIAVVLLLAPERIPVVMIVDSATYAVPSLLDSAATALPANLFRAFVNDGPLLLPVVVLALVIGFSLDFDTAITGPVIQLTDSLSRIFFQINSLIVEVFWIAIVAIGAATLISLGAAELALYRELILILVIVVIVLYLVVFPGLLYLLGERTNPYRWLYAALGPALAGALTGDAYVSLGSLLVHGRGSFGLPRTVTSAVFPLFALFGRAGTALVMGISYLMVLRSYTSFGVTAEQVLWAALFSFLISFAVGTVPGQGAMVGLALLWTMSGHGLREGHLIMQPLAPLLVSTAVLLDVTTAALAAHLVGRGERGVRPVTVRDFA